MKFGLEETIIEKIRNVFSAFTVVEEVIIYGSRANGNYKHGSDIDITVKGNNLTLAQINSISNRLDDLLLPYTFDISIFHNIDNKELLEHISRTGKIFYKSAAQKIKG